MYIVILENDGDHPSSSYYEKRARLALKVRGKDIDPNLGPVARRTRNGEQLAAIVQEGAILTPSYSQATMIAQLAQEYGVKTVFIGTADVTPFEATELDKEAFTKIQKALGKKGRKPEPELLTVTCYEEMLTFEVTASEVLICPNCGGSNIQTRNGQATRVRPPQENENLCVYWLGTRFPHGEFEIPIMDEAAVHWSLTADCIPPSSLPLVESLLSGMLGQIVNGLIPLTDKGKLDLLDSAYITRAYWPRQTRDHTRQQALISWIRDFQGSADFPLVEPEVPDVVDCAGLIGVKRALNIYKAFRMEKNNE